MMISIVMNVILQIIYIASGSKLSEGSVPALVSTDTSPWTIIPL